MTKIIKKWMDTNNFCIAQDTPTWKYSKKKKGEE